jgi:hypothetical protein
MPRFILYTERDRERAILLLKGVDIKNPNIFELKRQRKSRTVSQNKLYWMWLSCIAEETGDTREAIHEFYKNTFLNFTVEYKAFELLFIRKKSTTELDTKEFTTYLECIRQHAAEWNVILPLPEERGFEEFYSKYSGYIG